MLHFLKKVSVSTDYYCRYFYQNRQKGKLVCQIVQKISAREVFMLWTLLYELKQPHIESNLASSETLVIFFWAGLPGGHTFLMKTICEQMFKCQNVVFNQWIWPETSTGESTTAGRGNSLTELSVGLGWLPEPLKLPLIFCNNFKLIKTVALL